jgi:hypothetical protein
MYWFAMVDEGWVPTIGWAWAAVAVRASSTLAKRVWCEQFK